MARPAASDLKRRRRGDRRALARPRSGAVSGGTAGARAAAAQVAVAAQLACLLEASAPKPGNVHPGAAFHDTSYQDFLASAAAIGPAFARAGEQPLGRTIREAIEATARWVPRNSNLGIVLLLSPLARAALERGRRSLRDALTAVLAATTVDDAADAYAAIRLARPGGLGHAPEQDVARPPTVTLRAAMALAAPRDAIAREYATDFGITFDVGAPALRRALADGLSWSDAVVETFLTLLAASPDTHIARKLGPEAAAAVTRRAQDVAQAGGVRSAAGREALQAFDAELRDGRNTKNPGAAADLTAAAIFIALAEGRWSAAGRRGDAGA
ncbi:MAG: triphosphoribosyl-dephospho-CoA synthetase [Gemmatimonadetes bacterium]|nr:MAG: triphosphoribosyl-dephospho-CoA synthetase [Gemmatimonadota bacterium]